MVKRVGRLVGLTLGEEAALGEGLQLAPHPGRVQRRRPALRSDEQGLELNWIALAHQRHPSPELHRRALHHAALVSPLCPRLVRLPEQRKQRRKQSCGSHERLVGGWRLELNGIGRRLEREQLPLSAQVS